MDLILLLKAAVLGIVEGLTEFLPISSTGHLILASTLLGFHDERGKLFEIVIQSGAILAVCWEYRQRIARVVCGLPREREAQRFVINLILAFLPLAVLGLLFGKAIKAYLFNAPTVAATFILGGVFILWAEKRQHRVRVEEVEELTALDAIKLGFAQALALIPGTSRSGATIVGGLFFGLSRRAATEFSFFLAMPTMVAATVYSLFKYRDILQMSDLPIFAIGFVSTFIVAMITVRALLKFITNHSYAVFAWYRIAFGLVILATWQLHLIDWSTAQP